MLEEGLKAVKTLAQEEINTNVTLCFSPIQALMAAKAGAAYISPFVGRLDDISQIGMELVEEIITIYDNYGFETEVIVASVRNPTHVLDAALMGADIATIPFKVSEGEMDWCCWFGTFTVFYPSSFRRYLPLRGQGRGLAFHQRSNRCPI